MDSPDTQPKISEFSRNDTPASANHTLPAHASSGPSLSQKRSRQNSADSKVRPFGGVPTLGQRAWRFLLTRGQPIFILGLFVVGVASLIVALIDQDASRSDDVLTAKTLLSSRSGAAAATSVKSFAFGSAADDRSTDGASRVPGSLGEIPTASERPPPPPAGDPPLAAHAAPSPVLQPAAPTAGSAVNQPIPAIPPAGDPTLATQGAPIDALRSAAPTLASAVNRPTPAIPPAGDPPLATDAAPVPLLQSAAPASEAAANPLTPASPPTADPPLATDTTPIGAPQFVPPTSSGSAVKALPPAIARAGDPPLATRASPIDVPLAAAPTPGNAAVPLDKDEAIRLIKRGRDFLKEGDFAAARLLFERAADAGSAEAALALGSTYDPAVIKQLGAVSVAPDPDRARKWYGIAADRGSDEAVDRYANLNRAR
jgi:hypothetical protein